MPTMPNKIALQERLAELEKNLSELDHQINDLRGQRKAIRFALGLEAEVQITSTKPRASRSNVKRIMLELLEKAGASGINAAVAVEMAAREGIELNPGSASSNLSRLKGENVVTYDGDRYRLNKYSSGWGSNIHPYPASKSMP